MLETSSEIFAAAAAAVGPTDTPLVGGASAEHLVWGWFCNIAAARPALGSVRVRARTSGDVALLLGAVALVVPPHERAPLMAAFCDWLSTNPLAVAMMAPQAAPGSQIASPAVRQDAPDSAPP